jgi:uncharacterized membrane protein
LTHGDENPTPADEATQVRPNGRVREPDTGPVSAPAANQAEDDPGEPGNDRKRLEDYRPGDSVSDDQRQPDAQHSAPDGSGAVLEALQIQLEQRQWSGPLPPPAILYQYEQVQPGLAERIVAMAETAATGEIKTRDKLATAEIEQSRTGQALAFLLTIVALGAAIYFFAVHNPTAGGLLLSFPVIMLIRSFLTGIGSDSHKDEDDAGDSGRPTA